MSKIYLINDGVSRAVDNLITALIRDSLDGEFTLSFTLTENDANYINDETTAQHNGQYFYITGYSKDIDGVSPICAVECEHISYKLNDEIYSLQNFAMTGTPAQLVTAALSGTPFSVGVIEPAQTYTVVINETTSRRAVLHTIAATVGGEIEYNGYNINIRTHRGSVAYKDLIGTDNVTHVSLNRDIRENLTSYALALGRKTTLAAGDNVHIKFTPLSIDINTRIISIEYNPYNEFEVGIEVGDYVPDIVDSYTALSGQLTGAIQTFTVANGQLTSRIESAEGDISSLEQTASSLTSSITAANGNISTLQQTAFALTSRITAAEGDISSLEQTASSLTSSITTANGNISTLQQTANNLTLRIGAAENNILTVSLAADKVYWLIASGTNSSNFTMTSRAIDLVAANINLTGYVTFLALSQPGQTTINGSNITTGTLSASLIAANNGIYIQFAHPIMTTYVSGLSALYFGPYSYITKGDSGSSTPLEIYSYTSTRFTGSHPVYYTGGNAYPLLSTYNYASYISTTAKFG